MTSKSLPTQSASGGDIVKYALALLLAVAGLFAFYWFDGQWPTGVRVLAVVAGLVAGAAVFMATAKGAETREFLSEARFELRKVVWPTRQETLQTTLVVFVAVLVMGIFFWILDWILGSVTAALAGRGA